LGENTTPKKFLSPKKLIAAIVDAARDKLAKDIRILDIAQKSSVASHFVICSGESAPQIKAIANHIADKLDDLRHQTISLEGSAKSGWIILDTGAVLVHIMEPTVRAFYNLEELWGKCGIIYHE
jgi:ribosome-associated protein